MSDNPTAPDPSPPRQLTGSCRCGAVQFSVTDAFLYAAYCHCSRCRRRNGSAFSAFGGIGRDELQVHAPPEQVWRVGERGEQYDARCKQCGSLLFSMLGERVHVQLGALTDTPTRKPDHHIFVASKAPWHDITDALPRFDALPP